jgi:hypothetical protein
MRCTSAAGARTRLGRREYRLGWGILRGVPAHDYEEDKVEGVEPKVEAEIRRCVAEIAERPYPRVWVGKEDWIEGEKAIALIPDHFVENALGNLHDEVGVVRAAKEGAVMVQSAFTIAYAVGEEVDALSEDDRLSIRAAWFEYDGGPAAMFYTGSTDRMVPLDELTGDDVDEHLLETLDFYASGDTFEPYVVEDTPRSRALVEWRWGG